MVKVKQMVQLAKQFQMLDVLDELYSHYIFLKIK